MKHNLFQQSKWSRTIDLNTTNMVLFKSPRDVQQIGLIGRQLNNTQFLRESYELATKQPFGHLLNDLDPKTSDALRYSSNIVPPGPSIFYLPSAKAVITNLTDERERSMYVSANATTNIKLKKLIKSATKKFIYFLCECFLNVVNGNVPIKKNSIETEECSFRKILTKQTSLKAKKIFVREIELLKTVSFAYYLYLKKPLCMQKNSF